MKVLILCHSELVPPPRKYNFDLIDNYKWRTEMYVYQSLIKNDHRVRFCGISNSLLPLKNSLKTFKPDVVFNMLEEFDGEGLLESFAVSYLESIGQPYTGCDSIGLILSKNKLAAKEILASQGIKVPDNRRYPKIVKLIDEESSLGIDELSVVNNRKQELAQRQKLAKKFSTRFFSEQYIAGRELHIGVISIDGKIKTTPIWETKFGALNGLSILTEKVKWDFKFRKKMGIQLQLSDELSKSLRQKIQETAIKCFCALELKGYARIDFRLQNDDQFYVLEANPNPDLAYGDEFAECMRSCGYNYDELIDTILHEAKCKNILRATL